MRLYLVRSVLLLAALSLPVHAQGSLPLTGTYALGDIWGYAESDCAGPGVTTLIGAEYGTVTFQAGGTYAEQLFGSEACGSGTITSGPDSGVGTYRLASTGLLTLDPSTEEQIMATVSPDLRLMVTAASFFSDGPFLATLVKLSSGMSASSLTGRYHFAEFGMRNDGTGLFSWVESGVLTFDGVGTYSGSGTMKTLDAAGAVAFYAVTPGGGYSVAADGRLTFGAGLYPGAVASDGGYFFAVDNTGQELRLMVGFPESTAATPDMLGGDWTLGSFMVEGGTDPDMPAFFCTLLDVDVDTGLRTVWSEGTLLWSSPLGAGIDLHTSAGTYSLAPDGTSFYYDAGLTPGMPGAFDPGGKVGFYAGLLPNTDVSLLLLLHFGPPPLVYGSATPGSGGIEPTLSISGGFSNLGNAGFGIHVENGLGGAPGVLGVSLKALAPIGFPVLGGLLWIDPFALISQPGIFLSGATGVPGAGWVIAPVPLPADPALDGLELFSQAFVLDVGAGGGVAMSPALVITLTR